MNAFQKTCSVLVDGARCNKPRKPFAPWPKCEQHAEEFRLAINAKAKDRMIKYRRSMGIEPRGQKRGAKPKLAKAKEHQRPVVNNHPPLQKAEKYDGAPLPLPGPDVVVKRFLLAYEIRDPQIWAGLDSRVERERERRI